jgi:hypothetical protein
MLGVDKVELEHQLKQPISKYTREGVNVADRERMIAQLLDKNPKVKWLIYAVDAWMFTGEGLSENSYKLFYPFLDDKTIGPYINQYASFGEYAAHKWIKTSRYNEGLVSSAMRGYLGNWSNLKFGQVDVLQLEENIRRGAIRRINSRYENRAIFLRTLKLLKAKGIQVVLVYVPTISQYNKAEAEKFKQEIEFFEFLAAGSDTIFYLEYIKGWDDQYEYFFDPIHLNPEGQKKFTKAFAQDFNKLIDGFSGL